MIGTKISEQNNLLPTTTIRCCYIVVLASIETISPALSCANRVGPQQTQQTGKHIYQVQVFLLDDTQTQDPSDKGSK